MKNPFQKQPDSSKSDAESIGQMFSLFRVSFLRCYQGGFVDKTILEDICQDSFMALHHALQRGIELEGFSLFKYLFKTGSIMLKKYIEKRAKHPHTNIDELPEWMDTDDSSEWMEMQKIAREEVNLMEKICKEVLDAYYADRKSMREIAEEKGYKNEQIAKNRKYLCIQKLEKRLRERFRKEGFDLN